MDIGRQQQISNVSFPVPSSISPQLRPTSSMSAVRSRLQEFLGGPFFV